jgi:DNA-binding Lrp family transcriptional regulator
MESSPLDGVDREILYQLQTNARKPITDIADATNVSDNTVRNRIDDLEEAGVIKGYQVNVNYDHAGVQHYYIFVCTAVVSERESLARQARKLSGVVEIITLMTGTSNVYILGAGTEKDDMTHLAYDVDGLGLQIEYEHLVRAHERRPFEGFHLQETI